MKHTIKHLIKPIARNVHELARRSSSVSRAYLNATSVIFKHMPDNISNNFLANVQGVQWPVIQFTAKKVWVTKKTQLNLVPHVGEFDFAALYLRELSYEQEVFNFLEKRLTGYDAVVEVGANVGVFTNFFSHVMKQNKKHSPVFAFEPSREAFQRLLQNLAANNVDNVYAFNCALSNETGFVDFFEPVGHLTNGSLSREFAGIFSQQVKSNPVVTLSGASLEDLLTSYNRILFKIDVEGAEADVLTSLKDIISSKQPDILLEVLSVDEENLNRLDFILNNYQLSNITETGLIRKSHFEANDQCRDYFLSPNLPRLSAASAS